MGIFDVLFSGLETRTKLSPQESFAGILLAASACDGHISEDEFQQLLTALFRMKLFHRVNEKQFNQVLNKLMGVLKKRGPEVLVDGCCETLPEELRKAAFANACNIVLSDGVLEDDEKQFMSDLTGKLHMDAKTAQTIAQVMVIKNKG
ncbi:MAG: tellurite resistance TerB family protein [Candidatus Nealsonbacteria bacterium]|nr:tellurite resistance TerB family protein [Candidatus Nealsonbacteria bacterium]